MTLKVPYTFAFWTVGDHTRQAFGGRVRVPEYFYEKQIKIIFADLSGRITICYK
jgi:hypothetical protein